MSFLHGSSCECIKSELNIFELPPTQTTIENSQWIHYKPFSSLTDSGPLEFIVPGHGDEYIDLSHTMLNIKVELTENDNASAEAKAHHPGVVNNLMHSLFSQVDVSLNQKLVSPSNNGYGYRAYIENLLNYNNEAKKSHLTSVLWFKDLAGKMDDLTDANTGLKTRKKYVRKSKTTDLLGHLHCDIFNQEKFLLNGVEMKVRMVRARENFYIMSQHGSAFRLRITDASLIVRRVKISPGILLAHAKALAKTTAKYPLTRVEVKSMSLHSGIHAETLDNVILGQLPKRIILGFVNNKAYNGDYELNPFNFQHFNINFLSLYLDGVQIPSRPLQPDFSDSNLYIDAYHTLYSGTGIHFLNEGNNISREEYPAGYCLFAFDLTPDLSSNSPSHWNLVRHGSIRIEVRFAQPLTESTNCIIYSEFDNCLEIDASRQVNIDFGN